MKRTLVVFTSNNARILVNGDPAEYPHALVNPDLSAVKKLAPHFWKLVDGKIVPMTPKEQKARLVDHALRGVDNDISGSKKASGATIKKASLVVDRAVWAALAGAGSGLLAGWLL